MHLGLALALELSLLLIPQLLVELGALAGLVAVKLCGQSSIDLARAVLLGEVLVLVLTLSLALELVGDGSLVLCGVVSMLRLVYDMGSISGSKPCRQSQPGHDGNLLESRAL